MPLLENISLSKYTTFHVGGAARYFMPAKNDDDIRTAVEFAFANKLPFLVLGKGSNVLFPDEGYPGVIIHMEDRSLMIDDLLLTAASGVFMRQLVNFAHTHGLVGLEELAGIPGTVGGAVRGNAGTWTTEIKDVISEVEIATCASSGWQISRLTREECGFEYRHSTFKSKPDWIILRSVFKLRVGDVAQAKQAVLKDLQQRHERQPYDAPSAGSTFKNPDKAKGIFAGKLIEGANLKGSKVGGAEISPKHANFIINRGQATSSDIRQLITLIQTEVQKKNGILLEPEIMIVPPPASEADHVNAS